MLSRIENGVKSDKNGLIIRYRVECVEMLSQETIAEKSTLSKDMSFPMMRWILFYSGLFSISQIDHNTITD